MTREIYFICPNTRHPSGGIKQMYQMVDHLNELGYQAYIVRSNSRKSIKWFKYNTKIKYYPYLFFLIKYLCVKRKSRSSFVFKWLNFFRINRQLPSKDSIIVFPEIYGENINSILPNNYVIFNQNCFLTFNLFNIHNEADVYDSDRMLAGITVSKNSLQYLQYTFPQTPFYRIRLGLPSIFKSGNVKKKQITYMPRKLASDSNQVLNILRERDVLKGWEIIAIDNLSQEDVASKLCDSAIFLSFNHQEGFGLPPVEAMASGCYIIGYAGFGGKEYLDSSYSSPILDGDIIAYAKEVERVVNVFNVNPETIIDLGRRAAAFVKNEYSVENEKLDTAHIWKEIFENYKS